MAWLTILEWWRRITARRRLLATLYVLPVMVSLSLTGLSGCVRVPDSPVKPINPKPRPGVVVAPDPVPVGEVDPAQFGEDLAVMIEAGRWDKTDKFFSDATEAAKLCGVDPKLLDGAFGEVGKNRTMDGALKAEFAAKARGIK